MLIIFVIIHIRIDLLEGIYMPVLRQPITGSTNYILFPIIRQISKRILDILDLADEIGDRIYINTDWSTHSKTSRKDHRPNIGHQSLKVEASVQLNPSSQKWDVYTFTHTSGYGVTKNQYSDLSLIYSDAENLVSIHEQTTPVTIVLSCELFVQSKDLAFRTPQQIFNGYNNGDVITYQDLVYEYPIPKNILLILTNLWMLDRDYGKPAGIAFMDYVSKYTNGTWSVVANRDKKESVTIVKNVYDLKCLVSIEYSDDKPQVELKDKMPVAFGIPFVCTVQFSMPGQNIINYPIMYNNQLVPEACIPVARHSAHNRLLENGETRAQHVGAQMKTPTDIWRVPFYDDWYIPAGASFAKAGMIPVAILNIQVDEGEEYTTVDLKQKIDDEIEFKPIMKEFWYQAENDVFQNNVPYGMRLFKDDFELLPVDASFTEDLVLRFKHRNLRNHYRLVILVAGNVSSIDLEKWGPWLMENFPYLTGGLKDKVAAAIRKEYPVMTLDLVGGMWGPPKHVGDKGYYGNISDNDEVLDKLKGDKYGNRQYYGISKVQIGARPAKKA